MCPLCMGTALALWGAVGRCGFGGRRGCGCAEIDQEMPDLSIVSHKARRRTVRELHAIIEPAK